MDNVNILRVEIAGAVKLKVYYPFGSVVAEDH